MSARPRVYWYLIVLTWSIPQGFATRDFRGHYEASPGGTRTAAFEEILSLTITKNGLPSATVLNFVLELDEL